MKILVIAYSRTGTTRSIARQIMRACCGTMHEIKDVRARAGPIGYLRCVYDAVTDRRPAIEPIDDDPAAYDLVILGAPVWAGHVAAPMRTFLERYQSRLRNVAFFCTMSREGTERAFQEMTRLAGRMPIATLALSEDEIHTNVAMHKLHEFIGVLEASGKARATKPAPQQEPQRSTTFAVTVGASRGASARTHKGNLP